MRRFGIDLAAIEFLDQNVMRALNSLKNYGLTEKPSLFLEFHGPQESTAANAELASSVCEDLQGKSINLPAGQNPWEIRHYVTEAIKQLMPGYSIVRNDVAFPISRLPDMVSFCRELADKHELLIHTFGHVGMGLLHALILARRENRDEWRLAQWVSDEIIKKSVGVGGTISGEHGIGLGHKHLLEFEHRESIKLMREIKKVFDPHYILNPGKIFDLK
jgi:D-lactate dehydrogenase (cytochrome)